MATALVIPSPSNSHLTSSPPIPTNRRHSAAAPPFPSLLHRCRSLQDLRQAHAAAVKSGLHSDLQTLTKLITFCCLHPSPTFMTYAHRLFDHVNLHSVQDPLLFNIMTRGYARTPTPLRALSIFIQMLENSVDPDEYSFSSVLRALSAAKSVAESQQVHAMILKLGFLTNSFVLPTLINLYAESGDLGKSRLLFEQAKSSSGCVPLCAISFNAMIMASLKNNRPTEALQLFRRMQSSSVEPTDVTILSVLSSCALLGSLELGKWAHGLARSRNFTSSVKISTAIIDMYAKCGSLEESLRVFHEMKRRDTQAWNAIIVACALHGRAEVAISLFNDMLNQNGEEILEVVKPDGVTFLGLLSACSHGGLVNEGLQFFRTMKVNFGVDPEVKHYGCMVDLLARSGCLRQAYEFIDALPAIATPVLWRTLLGACSNHGELQLGKQVFKRILELENSHGGDYVIFSNISAAAGEWEEVNAVRKKMRENGALKLPGCSCIEIGGAVNEFFAGGGSHRKAADLRRMLDEVAEQLKLVGYVPETSLVLHEGMSEKEKERSLRYHSEKMAMAYGLLNTAPGSTLRIVKNLRVCRDCHAMIKLASDVFGREILLRDVNRFHHFSQGNCSCGDYW